MSIVCCWGFLKYKSLIFSSHPAGFFFVKFLEKIVNDFNCGPLIVQCVFRFFVVLYFNLPLPFFISQTLNVFLNARVFQC